MFNSRTNETNSTSRVLTASRKLALATFTAAALAVVPVAGPVASADAAEIRHPEPVAEIAPFGAADDLVANPKMCMGREADRTAI